MFIIFDFQQLLLLTDFDQTHRYGDRIEAMFLVYFFIFLHAVYRTIIAPTKPLRTSFSPTVELLLIRSPRLYIIFDFQQLLLLTDFDQTHRYGDPIEAMFLVYFFIFLHAVYRTVIAPTETLRTSFSATVELLLIGSPRWYLIFDFQQLLLMTNFDQTNGYGDRIEAMFLVTLFHRSIDQAILLVTLSIERYFW